MAAAAKNVYAFMRTKRLDSQVGPKHKIVESGVPIPPVSRSKSVKYPWFDDVHKIGQSFHADTMEECHAFRDWCYRRGWRALTRAEDEGWRCWRIQ